MLDRSNACLKKRRTVCIVTFLGKHKLLAKTCNPNLHPPGLIL
jgi:hypothetical protein